MWHVVFAALAYLAMIAQTVWPAEAAVRGMQPDFLALLLAGALLVFQRRGALVWCAIAGFLADCLSGERLGVGMFLAVLVTLVLGKFVTPRANRSAVFATFLTFVLVFIFSASLAAIRLALQHERVAVEGLMIGHAIVAGYSSLIGLVLLVVWRTMKRLVPRPRQTSAAEYSRS